MRIRSRSQVARSFVSTGFDSEARPSRRAVAVNISALSSIPTAQVGGARLACLSLEDTARIILELAGSPRRASGPYYLTSANGEVLARRTACSDFKQFIDAADLISADGQPLVMASRFLSQTPLPERVATTDLFPIVARMAQKQGSSFYLFGGSESANRAAYERTRQAYPRLRILGSCSGFHRGRALQEKIDEINALEPDILWIGMGVPLEHEFVAAHGRILNVKLIKTSGGLFDFLAGAKKRAPKWMQHAGLEWAFRLSLEPQRLFKRYAVTNPIAAYLLLTQTR